MKHDFDEVKEKLGGSLLPVFKSAVELMNGLADAIQTVDPGAWVAVAAS